MTIKIFYSWQSDLENYKNRTFIKKSLDSVAKTIKAENSLSLNLQIDSDSREEMGTPDLSAKIFEKIDNCDIFIADISIINYSSSSRIMPNPNVLLELGYAIKTLGWDRILCIYNCEYSKIESLPFDIRNRKPITYNTKNDLKTEQIRLKKSLKKSISKMINDILLNKNEKQSLKFKIDLQMQAILIDFCKTLFTNKLDKYNYLKMLNISKEELKETIAQKHFLGFDIYKNVKVDIEGMVNFFNDDLETVFLNSEEKKIIAKLIYALKNYDKIISSDDFFHFISKNDKYTISTTEMPVQENSNIKLILLEKLGNDKAIVVNSGEFKTNDIKFLLNTYNINEKNKIVFVESIFNIIQIINKWIEISGKYFIADIK